MKRTTKTALILGAASSVLLAACAPDVREVPDPQSGPQSAAQSGSQSGELETDLDLTLSAEQIDRIVAELQTVLDRAQEENDPSILEERLVDPALSLRKGQFTRSEKTETDLAPLTIDPAISSATAGNTWPRVLVVASDASGDDPGQVFFLTQRDAKSSYMLENWTRLVGGTSVKGLSVQDGSKVLELDASGLLQTPEDTLTAYVNFLNSPDNEEYKIFEDNVFSPRYREELTALNEAVAVAGKVAGSAEAKDYPIIGVELETGSALVSSAFEYTNVYERTVPRSSFEMAGTPAAYLDSPSVIGKVSVTYLVSIFFLIPPEGSDEMISVVGSERVIKEVTRDDTEPVEDAG